MFNESLSRLFKNALDYALQSVPIKKLYHVMGWSCNGCAMIMVNCKRSKTHTFIE